MFVIPCRFDPARPVVFDCVASIKAHHPDATVVVVDSASDDTGYLDELDCITIDAENRNYGPGALRVVMDEFPRETFFYLTFDSLLVHDNLDDLKRRPLSVVRWFDSATTGWGWDGDGRPLEGFASDNGVWIPSRFFGVMGPMVFATRGVIESCGLLRIMPSSAYEQCALERIWGIWLQESGHDVSKLSLQGEMRGFFDEYPSDRVEKIAMARA